jgi:hypothetical protein
VVDVAADQSEQLQAPVGVACHSYLLPPDRPKWRGGAPAAARGGLPQVVDVTGDEPSKQRYDTKLWMRDLMEGAAYLPK